MSTKPAIVVQLAEFIAWADTVTYKFMGDRILQETGQPIRPMELAQLFLNEKAKNNGKKH